MTAYRVRSISANGHGPRLDVIIEANDRKHALVRAKMAWIALAGSLPRAGLRFDIEPVPSCAASTDPVTSLS